MQAFILAAGLGTRLRPLTNDRPKALVEVDGHPLLELCIGNLIRYGASRIVVNVHHFAAMMVQYITSRHWDAEIVISDESQRLLDTGGAIAHAASLFVPDEPVLIHNVDILSRIDLARLMRFHDEHKPYATLAVSRRQTSRQLLFKDNQLIGWHDSRTDEYKWAAQKEATYPEMAYAYSGIAVLSWNFIASLPNTLHPYPLVPCLLEAAAGHAVIPFIHNSADWLDVGKPDTLPHARGFLS